MPDPSDRSAHLRQLRALFGRLLTELQPAWPATALRPLREDLAHDEFGEALENLLSLALRDRHAVGPAALRSIDEAAGLMGLAGLADLARLRGRSATE